MPGQELDDFIVDSEIQRQSDDAIAFKVFGSLVWIPKSQIKLITYTNGGDVEPGDDDPYWFGHEVSTIRIPMWLGAEKMLDRFSDKE